MRSCLGRKKRIICEKNKLPGDPILIGCERHRFDYGILPLKIRESSYFGTNLITNLISDREKFVSLSRHRPLSVNLAIGSCLRNGAHGLRFTSAPRSKPDVACHLTCNRVQGNDITRGKQRPDTLRKRRSQKYVMT